MWFKRKPHVHQDAGWDGYYSWCRCGACSGDKRDSNGNRAISFLDW